MKTNKPDKTMNTLKQKLKLAWSAPSGRVQRLVRFFNFKTNKVLTIDNAPIPKPPKDHIWIDRGYGWATESECTYRYYSHEANHMGWNVTTGNPYGCGDTRYYQAVKTQ